MTEHLDADHMLQTLRRGPDRLTVNEWDELVWLARLPAGGLISCCPATGPCTYHQHIEAGRPIPIECNPEPQEGCYVCGLHACECPTGPTPWPPEAVASSQWWRAAWTTPHDVCLWRRRPLSP